MTGLSRPLLALLGASAACALVFAWAATSVDSAFAANEAGNAAYLAGDHVVAVERYREAERGRPELAHPIVNAANALHRMGELARALVEYDRVIAAPGADVRASAFYGRGNTLFRLGRVEEARGAYVDALRLDPDDRDAKFNIEVIDRLLAVSEQGPAAIEGQGPTVPGPPQGSAQPGGPAPGGLPVPGRPGAEGGPQQEGPPTDSSTPGEPAAPDLERALIEFRRELSLDEALRLLEALRGDQDGIEGIIEGLPFRRQPQDPAY